MYGNPKSVVSDNGPPFASKQFADFLQSRGITHRRVTPVWPQANGEAERFMRPLKKIIQTAYLEKKNFTSEVENFLFAYRNTPHGTTKISPGELIFNRKLSYNLPHIQQPVDNEFNEMPPKTTANGRIIINTIWTQKDMPQIFISDQETGSWYTSLKLIN